MSQPGRITPSSWVVLALILTAIVGLSEGARWWQARRQSGEIDMLRKQQTLTAQDVVMYTTSTCPYCAQARAWLTANGVPFEDCNVELTARCKGDFESQGSPGVPLMRVRGHWHLGFDAGWLVEALKAQPAVRPNTVTSPRP